MSEDDTIDPADGGKLIAAEYVLGVLGAEERREVERRLAQEPALASEVAFWEERLGGLADTVAPVSPPQATWSRIETAIGITPRPPSVWQSLAFWRSFGIASATLAAASIAALAYIGLVPGTRAPLLATLGGSAGQPNFVAAVTATGNSLVIVPARSAHRRPARLRAVAHSRGRDAAAFARAHSAGSADQARDPVRPRRPRHAGRDAGGLARAAGRVADRPAHRPGHRRRQADEFVDQRPASVDRIFRISTCKALAGRAANTRWRTT